MLALKLADHEILSKRVAARTPGGHAMNHVLIVDDDADSAATMRELVGVDRFSVAVAHTLRDARRQMGNAGVLQLGAPASPGDRKSTRLNSSHQIISYAVFCLKKKKEGPNVLGESTHP